MLHRFILEPYSGPSSRYICPNCGHKEFVRYIDIETKRHLDPSVGRCNREIKCGYHYTPREYFRDKNMFNKTNREVLKMNQNNGTVSPSYIDKKIVEKTLTKPHKNPLVRFLCSVFDPKEVIKVVNSYRVGTANLWGGACVFWQIDINGNVRGGKVMAYDPETGKRVKGKINWVHTILKLEGFNLKQCLFGEHLIHSNNKTIAVVESEKTALIGAIYFPKFQWVATGGLSNLTAEKLHVLRGRNVVLIPDLGGFDKWNEKAKGIREALDLDIEVYKGLEEAASEEEREQGLDIADYFIKMARTEPDSVEKRKKLVRQVVTAIDEKYDSRGVYDWAQESQPELYQQHEDALCELGDAWDKPLDEFVIALDRWKSILINMLEIYGRRKN